MSLALGLAVAAFPRAAEALDLTVGSGVVENCPATGKSAEMAAGAVAYAEPMPVVAISGYGRGRYDPAPGNNIGVGVGYGEITGSLGKFCTGLVYRAEYYAQASKDLLDVLVGNHFGRTFDNGRTYALSMKEESFRSGGLRFARTFRLQMGSRWVGELGIGATYLHATEGARQALAGQVTATSADYAVGEAMWLRTQSDINHKTFSPFVPPGTPRGDGFTDAFEFRVRGNYLSFTALVMDAVGRIYWRGMPHSIRTLQNTSVAYNANFDRDALINGVDSRINLVEAIPRKLHFEASVPVAGAWKADLEDDEVGGYHFPSFGARFDSGGVEGRVDYDIRTRAVELGGGVSWLTVSVTANRFRPDEASALGVFMRLATGW